MSNLGGGGEELMYKLNLKIYNLFRKLIAYK